MLYENDQIKFISHLEKELNIKMDFTNTLKDIEGNTPEEKLNEIVEDSKLERTDRRLDKNMTRILYENLLT